MPGRNLERRHMPGLTQRGVDRARSGDLGGEGVIGLRLLICSPAC